MMRVQGRQHRTKALADPFGRIYATVISIPRGCVASYGQIAALAGLPRRARLVGRALAECPDHLPWHRVLNSAGRISLPVGSASRAEQVRRLVREGVPVRDGKVAIKRFRWQPDDLDALLWGPRSAVAKQRRAVAPRSRP